MQALKHSNQEHTAVASLLRLAIRAGPAAEDAPALVRHRCVLKEALQQRRLVLQRILTSVTSCVRSVASLRSHPC